MPCHVSAVSAYVVIVLCVFCYRSPSSPDGQAERGESCCNGCVLLTVTSIVQAHLCPLCAFRRFFYDTHVENRLLDAFQPIIKREVLDRTAELLSAINNGNEETYAQLCDGSMTCFEPEANGYRIQGLEFHKTIMDNDKYSAEAQYMVDPHVRLLNGGKTAVVTYIRLMQVRDANGHIKTVAVEETRIWELQSHDDENDGVDTASSFRHCSWRCVHFHRSKVDRN